VETQYARFYTQFVHPGDLCFDVGANVGRRTGAPPPGRVVARAQATPEKL
jgi:hypothetical protein